MARLNIFIDETGEFGFNKNSAKLYGVSMVFHEQKHSIEKEIKVLENRLELLGFNGMIHMGDLVNGHGDFDGMSIAKRRKIYNILYRFSTRIEAKYQTMIIDKHNYPDIRKLSQSINGQITQFIIDNDNYFQQFNRIIVYYDGGQKPLNRIIHNTFLKTLGAGQKNSFRPHRKETVSSGRYANLR